MRKYIYILIIIVFLFAIPEAKAQCVPESEVVDALSSAMNFIRYNEIPGTMTLECNPCRCPSGDDGMARCYEYMAQEERSKAERVRKIREVVRRAKEFGVCK